MRGKWLLALSMVVILAVAAGLITLARSGPRTPPRVSTSPPKPATIVPSEVSLQGTIQAKTVVNIAAPLEGTLERVVVNVGDSVYEGQLLASIKNSKLDTNEQSAQADAAKSQERLADLENASRAARLEASRARAEATQSKIEFDRAEKMYLRQQMLVAEGATPRLVFEKAEKDFNTLKADSASLEQLAQKADAHVEELGKQLETARKLADAKGQDADEAKAELAGSEVHSTVDGLVVGRRGQAGDAVNRSMLDLFQIATSLGSMQVLLTPDSKLLPVIRAGQPALVQIAEVPGGVSGAVREVKGGQVFVDFASPSAAIKPGMTAQVIIKLS